MPASTAIESRMLKVFGVMRKYGMTPTDDGLKAEWFEVDRIKRQHEKPIQRAAQDLFSDQAKEVVQRLEQFEEQLLPAANQLGKAMGEPPADQWGHVHPSIRSVLTERVLKQDLLMGTIFDLEKWDREVFARFTPLIAQVLEAGFTTGLDRVGIEGVDFTSDSPAARYAINQVALKTKEINGTTFRKLTQLVSRELPNITNMDQLTQQVNQQFAAWRGPRAAMIAETVGVAGFESGQQMGFEEAGIPGKGWLSQRDGQVRPPHFEADGQVVAIREKFRVGGEMLKHPGDPAGSAKNVIRCRCTSTPKELPNDEQVLDD